VQIDTIRAPLLRSSPPARGRLLSHDGHFMQVIEGEEHAVRETFARIRRDSRQRDIAVLFGEPISERLFCDRSMGFQPLDGSELLAFPDADGRPAYLRRMAHDIGGAKKLMPLMRSRGLDPAKDVLTSQLRRGGASRFRAVS
jgi:hypothetical protein